MAFPVFVINLDADLGRYQRILDQVTGVNSVDIHRISAVFGSSIPDSAAVLLTRNEWSPNHKGTLGCFLSHVKAWEKVIKDQTTALIIEDDVLISSLDQIATLDIPDETDIVFANERTSFAGSEGLRDISQVLEHIGKVGVPPGGDGYILTPKGASKLIEFVKIDSFFSHVDLRLLAYCADMETAQRYRTLSSTTETIYGLRRAYAKHSLNGLSMFPPLVRHHFTGSVREAQDKAGAINVKLPT